MNYEQDIALDPQALDVEWTRQAELFFKYASAAADARDRSDRQKERVDVLEADL